MQKLSLNEHLHCDIKHLYVHTQMLIYTTYNSITKVLLFIICNTLLFMLSNQVMNMDGHKMNWMLWTTLNILKGRKCVWPCGIYLEICTINFFFRITTLCLNLLTAKYSYDLRIYTSVNLCTDIKYLLM